MKGIIAIALIALRSAIRSRLVASLIVALFLVLLGLPETVKGDGTLAGQVRILLFYTLGIAVIILGAATLWASCGAVSQEIKEKQMQLVAVKPVHRFQIWLGKWLGLLVMNAALLCLVWALTCAIVQWNLRFSKAEDNEIQAVRDSILVGRRVVPPQWGDIDRKVNDRLDLLIAEQSIPPDIARKDAFRIVKRDMLVRRCTAAPSQSALWTFDLPPGKSRRAPMTVRVRFFSLSGGNRTAAGGVWSVGPTNGPMAAVSLMEKNFSGNHSFAVPPAAIPESGPMAVLFLNHERSASGTIAVDPENGIEVLITESPFGMNLARALFLVFCQLAVMAALGLTAGALFSFPVATFFAGAVLVIALLAQSFHPSAAPVRWSRADSSPVQVAARSVLGGLNAVAAPAVEIRPLENVSDGVLVSWLAAGRTAAFLLVAYPMVLGAIAGYVLNRRELALPE